MLPVKSLLYFFVIVSLCASCKSKQKAAAPKSNIGGEILSEKDRIDFEFLFFDATKEKLLGNFSQAQVKFQQAIRINPRASAAHFELSQVYLNTGNPDLAELSGKNAVRFDDSNKWYKLSLADIYAQNGKFGEVAELMNQLHKKEPNNQEYLLGLGTALVNEKKYSEAAKVYEELEILTGINEEVALQKKNLFMRLGKPEKAILEIQKLMNAFPDEIGYRGFLAEIYEDTNQPEKALEEYNEIIKRDPENPNVHFSLAEYYRRQGDKEKSYQELKKAFANPESSLELKIQVLSSYFDITLQYPELVYQAMELCRELVLAHPEDPQAHAVYGDFLLREEKLQEAREQYMLVLAADKARYNVWNQLLLIDSELNNYQNMFDLSKEAMELFPYQPTVYLYNGIAAIQLKQYEKAIESLKAGANVTTSNAPLSSQFFASLGDCYNYTKQYKESDESYEMALKFDSSNTYVMNNFAYYLSLRKENLNRAKQLSQKCNELEPGSPSFQDTFAWILFEMGDLENASIWIDKAIENGGIKSGTIMEHKGDILIKQGKTADALDFWNRAKELGGVSDKIDLKIAQKKYIF
jgi:tetratricopeptide (TPR) repeat protein